MSKKDFIALAEILAGDYATASPAERMKVFKITLSMADYFAKCSPNFRRDIFYAAVFGESNPHLVAADFSLAGNAS
jgi:hypothetical protein